MSNAWIILPLTALMAACQPPPQTRHAVADADPAAGREIVERLGCGSCHEFPGLRWPRGRLAPVLDGYAGKALTAGRLPNGPDLLAAFVRDAPRLVPGTTMPALPLSERESHDVAAYLYTLE